MTHEEIVKSKWKKVLNRIHGHWTRLTLEDLDKIRQADDALVPALQARYGYNSDYAKREIRLWFDRQCTMSHPDLEGDLMLITFTSKSHPDIVMFGDVATVLLKAMGQSERAPGILRGEDIRLAHARLQTYLDELPESRDPRNEEKEPGETVEDEIEFYKDNVSLKRRALPLLELLAKSYQDDSDIIWR